MSMVQMCRARLQSSCRSLFRTQLAAVSAGEGAAVNGLHILLP